MKKYYVHGGVFLDTTFNEDTLIKAEFYGPFNSYDEARKSWWENTCRQVDICEHRLFLETYDEQ